MQLMSTCRTGLRVDRQLYVFSRGVNAIKLARIDLQCLGNIIYGHEDWKKVNCTCSVSTLPVNNIPHSTCSFTLLRSFLCAMVSA